MPPIIPAQCLFLELHDELLKGQVQPLKPWLILVLAWLLPEFRKNGCLLGEVWEVQTWALRGCSWFSAEWYPSWAVFLFLFRNHYSERQKQMNHQTINRWEPRSNEVAGSIMKVLNSHVACNTATNVRSGWIRKYHWSSNREMRWCLAGSVL
jgi:hypothetical protein